MKQYSLFITVRVEVNSRLLLLSDTIQHFEQQTSCAFTDTESVTVQEAEILRTEAFGIPKTIAMKATDHNFTAMEPAEMGYHETMDFWLCACGNYEKADGLMACGKTGNLISPIGAEHCRCERCGRVIHVASHTIIGINPNPDRGRFTRGIH